MIDTDRAIRDALQIDNLSRDSYVLYGSYARGDHDPASDVDVLRITTKRMRANRIDGHVSLHIYDIKDLLVMAQQGNLFILHLLREARPLHDPCKYLMELSTAFQKPTSYVSTARQMVQQATCLLEINESLFETAPKAFLDVSIFLCRTLIYAEHADQGPFSFSLRSLAAKDETANMISKIKGRSVSYSDFRTIAQVVSTKVGKPAVWSNASSIEELTQRGQGDPLFDGLIGRIVERLGFDAYVMPAKAAEHK